MLALTLGLAVLVCDAASEAISSRARSAPSAPQADDLSALHTHAEAMLERARTSQMPDDYKRADGVVAQALERAPDHPRTLALKAWTQMNAHRFREALRDAQSALERDENDRVALAVAADAATELGLYEAAIGFTDRLLARRTNLPALTRAAHLRYLHGDLSGALELAERQFNQFGNDESTAAWSLLQLSELYLAAGQLDRADQAAQAARELKRDAAQPLAQRAKVAEARGNFAAAQALYRQANAIQVNAEHALGMLRCAMITNNRAEAQRARTLLAGLAKLDALNGALGDRTFAEFYLLQGDLVQAERLARRELERRPDVYSQSQLGWILLARADAAAARPHAEQSIATASADPLLAYRAGRIFEAVGDKDRGAKLIARACQANPGLCMVQRSARRTRAKT
ncbi:MAG TPA: hypothetical protein VFB54_18540 [Burkholderiales bacterium]|nr:hypothetical protein [Burkholderiales bacterium]